MFFVCLFCFFFTRQHSAVVRTWILEAEVFIHFLVPLLTRCISLGRILYLSVPTVLICDVRIMRECKLMRLFKRLNMS